MALSSDAPIATSRFDIFRSESLVTLALLCAFTFSFLFASSHNTQRGIELIALSGVAIAVLVRVIKGHVPTLSTSAGSMFLIFFILGLASATMALSLRHAIFEWSVLLILLVAIFFISSELKCTFNRISSTVELLGFACILYSLRVAVMYVIALASGFQPDWSVIAAGFSNHRFLNHTQTALLPLVILLCIKAPPDSGWRKTWFALGAFWWSLLLVTEARASILALTGACALTYVLRRFHARQFILTMALTALAGAILYVVLFTLLPMMFGVLPLGSPMNVLERTAVNPTSNRNILWEFAFQTISAHPWFGIGPHHFAHAAIGLNTGAHPHNWLLQIAVEWGIPALLCLLGAVFLGARALVRSGSMLAPADRTNQQMLVMLQVACTAIFVDGLFSGVIVMPQSQLAIALVLGLAVAWVRLQGAQQHDERSPSPAKRAVISLFAAAGLCGLLWSVAPDLVRFAYTGAPTSDEHIGVPGMLWPRMWEDGYF